MKSFRAGLACLLVVAAPGSFSPPTHAANASEMVRKRSDLQDLQRQIRALERTMAETVATHSTAAQQLAEAERAVSDANRRLRKLADELAASETKLATQEAERLEVEKRIAARQEELGGWLRRHYMHGGSDVAPILSGRDPNQLARDVRYLEHIGRARMALIDALRDDLREQKRLVESIAARRDELAALGAEQRRQNAALDKVLSARATAVAKLAGQLQGQEREVRFLRENEQQLGRMVELLARQAEQREAERRRAATDQAALSSARPGPPAQRPELAVAKVRPGARSPSGVAFAQLRGRLGFPVRGELVGRFGAPRAEGGTRWRGLFIRAGKGEDVVAIADGEVVFSDWMRGYGNLIIVDHGDDYLTIYGNNDVLLRVVGERIEGGTPIASVGASGGAQESGLYFEIRHAGEPVDPMQWVRNR